MESDRVPGPAEVAPDRAPGSAATASGPARAECGPTGADSHSSHSSHLFATTLRSAMHLAFAVLPAVGVFRAIGTDGVSALAAICAAVLVAGLYFSGAWVSLRHRAGTAATGTDLLLPGRGWTLALVAAWVGSTLISSAFVWLAFPLFFLVLFALGRAAGIIVLALVTLWAVLAPLIAGAQDVLGIGEIVGPVVGAVFSLVAYAVYRQLAHEVERNQRLVEQLRAAQSELAESERRKGVAEERQRLAQDIHDTLAQGLNSIVLLGRTARTAHPEAAEEFTGIEDTARANLADARRLVRDLSDRDSGTSLEQALRTVISRAERLGPRPQFELRIDGTARDLSADRVETLHRAAQSLVANVQQHADAQRCVLTLAWWPDRVSLDVVDDGRGFDPATASTQRHRSGGDGLRLLRSRVARAGGAVTIDAARGEGTTVGVSVPARDGEEDA